MLENKTVLIIGYVFPEPKSSAAGNRMMQLIDLFQNQDYFVTFATTAQNIEFSEDLSKSGVTVESIELNSTTFDDFIVKLNPTIVVFDRFMIEEQFGWRVTKNCPNALKILNTEDLHSLRFERESAIKKSVEFQFTNLLTSDIFLREIASIYRCDCSLFVSDFEIELLKNQFNISEKLLYYLPIFAEKLDDIPAFEDRNDFIFIGNFLHAPNVDAVLQLKNSIWDIIHKQLPKAKMMIYGAYPSQKITQLHNPKKNFFVLGRADNAIEVVKTTKVVLAPLRFGAGIKGKLLEAMQCGTPSCTTLIGAEAINNNLDWNGFIDDNPTDFATKAVELYQNKNLWEKCQQNGFQIIETRFSKSFFETKFKNDLENLKAHYLENRKYNFIGSMLQQNIFNASKYMSKWIEEKNKNKP